MYILFWEYYKWVDRHGSAFVDVLWFLTDGIILKYAMCVVVRSGVETIYTYHQNNLFSRKKIEKKQVLLIGIIFDAIYFVSDS